MQRHPSVVDTDPDAVEDPVVHVAEHGVRYRLAYLGVLLRLRGDHEEAVVDRPRLLAGGLLGAALGIHRGRESGEDGLPVRDPDLDLAAFGQAGLAQASLDALPETGVIGERRSDEDERGGQSHPAAPMGVTTTSGCHVWCTFVRPVPRRGPSVLS